MITLARRQTEFGDARVVKSRSTGAVFYYHGNSCQSEADHHGISLAPYIHAIYDLLVQHQAQRILMIGCGGGTLGTMLARSGRSVVIVDDDPHAITIAKRYFALPFEVTCHVEDGLAFLEQNRKPFDAIVVDAFIEDRIPDHLCSGAFFRAATRSLAAGGAILVNTLAEHDFDFRADQIAVRLSGIGFNTLVLDTTGLPKRNAIVVASSARHLALPLVHFTPAVEAAEMQHDLKRMKFRKPRTNRPTVD
ncbi:MAG TPA: fused MFS/spermidine synthase [Dongiaceae bacterium]|nr:fused MFS/spermidine synthase [Dongiaceae bacterium]